MCSCSAQHSQSVMVALGTTELPLLSAQLESTGSSARQVLLPIGLKPSSLSHRWVTPQLLSFHSVAQPGPFLKNNPPKGTGQKHSYSTECRSSEKIMFHQPRAGFYQKQQHTGAWCEIWTGRATRSCCGHSLACHW